MDVRTGDLVVFQTGLYKDEDGAIYRVLEVNGNRCVLEFVSSNMVIHPESVAILSDLKLFIERK